MPKITKRLVEAAEVRDKDYIICDDDLAGFAVRVLPSGRRSYIAQYRIALPSAYPYQPALMSVAGRIKAQGP